MKIFSFSRKNVMALCGFLLIACGGVGLLLAQRQPARQVIRLSSDGAYLGIEMEDVSADNLAKYKLSSETGVIIRSVEKGSSAEAARLQENDVILEYAGIPVFSAAELSRLVEETPVNRTVNLAVSRDGKKLNIPVKLGERSGVNSGRITVLPQGNLDRLFDFNGRQYEFTQPGGGAFQFNFPEGRGRVFSLTTPSRPQLGVTVEALTDQMASFLGVPGKSGLLINSVTPGSPAASVLKAGDVILSVDGKTLANPTDLTQAIARKEPSSKVDLKIIRDKKEMSATVEFPKRATGGIKI